MFIVTVTLLASLFVSSASAQDVVDRPAALQKLPLCAMVEVTPGECQNLSGMKCGEVEFPQNSGAFVPTTPVCPLMHVGKQVGNDFVPTVIDLGNGRLVDAMIGEAGLRKKFYAVRMTSGDVILRGSWYNTDGSLVYDGREQAFVTEVSDYDLPSSRSCKTGPIRYNEVTATVTCEQNKK